MSLQLIEPVTRIRKSVFLIYLFLLLQPGRTYLLGQVFPDDQAIDPSRLEVSLLTVGPGNAIWERFGHNALIFQDTITGRTIAYNWGIFDFRQDDFLMRLARGRMQYSMRGFPTLRLIESYRSQNRTVWSQRINLTTDQKLELLSLVTEMDTESNRYYRYDYYRDNCSSRIRDALDKVLKGGISSVTQEQKTEHSYRSHTARILHSSMSAYLGIQFVVGNYGDNPLSVWEEMFLPLSMKDYLQTVLNPSMKRGGSPLLEAPQILFESSRKAQVESGNGFFIEFLLLGLFLGGVFLLCGWGKARGYLPARYCLGILGGLWSILAGALGTLLLLSWFLTDHFFWTLNENIFQANPTSLVLGIALLASLRQNESKSLIRVARAVCAIAFLGLIVKILPGIDQVNGEIIALTFPVNLGLYLGIKWSWR